MPGVYAADLSRRVALAPADVWAALEDTSAYRTWWPWLHDFRPDGGLVTGATWHAGIRAPLPYVVHDGDRIAQLVIGRLAEATFEEAPELSETARGAGGHGSTGR